MRKKILIYRPMILGALGTFALLGLYVLILGVSMSLEYAFIQLFSLWNWMVPLVAGFGVQVGLFFYMRGFKRLSLSSKVDNKAIVASASVSTGTMIACCLHHVTDVLPIIGLTAASLFLAQYQTIFLAVGIGSNLIGFFYVLYIIRKHHLYFDDSRFEKLNQKSLKVSMWGSGLLSFIWVLYLTVNN